MKNFLEVVVPNPSSPIEGESKMLLVDVDLIVMVYQNDDGSAMIEIYRQKTQQDEVILCTSSYSEVVVNLGLLPNVEVV